MVARVGTASCVSTWDLFLDTALTALGRRMRGPVLPESVKWLNVFLISTACVSTWASYRKVAIHGSGSASSGSNPVLPTRLNGSFFMESVFQALRIHVGLSL